MIEKHLNILMIAPTPYFSDRGCHVRIYEEARTLTDLSHRVCIATYHIGRNMHGISTVRIPEISWYKKIEAGPSWQKPFLDLLLTITAYRTARKFHPDIIHAHLHEGVLIGYILHKLLRIPLIFDYQGGLTAESLSHGFFQVNSPLHKLFSQLEQWLNNRADAIITSSSVGKTELVAQWGIKESKIDTLIDGVDTDIFYPFPKQQIRQKLKIPENFRVLVYLGLFNQYQGVDLLLNALKIVMENEQDIHALLMGFPEEKYITIAEELGIADKCTFTGRIEYDRAAEYISAGDVAVSPKLSKTEANGKLFNYMACELPTVVFESQINREILGEYAYYAEFGSTQSFAEQIISALNGLSQNRFGKKSRERAIDNHSWRVRGENLVQIYKNIMNK